jgi:hypothetical protein
MVTGDFNGDGKLDLAVADTTGIVNCYVLLGNGDGTFQTPRPLPVQHPAQALAVGHFHDPHILDLVVTERNQIEVFLGNGDGTFQAPVAYAVGMNYLLVVGVVVGDLNGDLHDDLVVVNSSSRTLDVLYGNPDGTFQNAVTFAAYPSPNWLLSLALADLNGDGKLDVVTGNDNGTYGDASEVSVLLNLGNDAAGNAQFGPPAHYLTRMDVVRLVVNDFSTRGKPDVAFASSTGQAVGVFLGVGDGTLMGPPLLSPTSFSSGGSSLLASGDFDGDGKLDLAMVASFGYVTVLYGKGDGTFGPPSYYAFPSSTWSVAVGDFNGDSSPDLAVGSSSDGTVAILLNAVGRGGGGGGGPGAGSDIRESHDIQAILDFWSTLPLDTYDNRVDALLAGATGYDTPDQWQQAFMALMNEWTQATDYATRVDHLLNGGGLNDPYLLNAATVHSNGGGNVLTGHGGGASELNLYFGSLALDMYDWNPATETFVSV